MEHNNYLVYDAETTIRNDSRLSELVIGKSMASPFHPDNEIIMEGWKYVTPIHPHPDVHAEMFDEEEEFGLPPDLLLVGQNIKFDLHYLFNQRPEFMRWIESGGKIWCTMLAEYILTFQQKKWASLDYLAVKYGGTVKNDKMKAFWEAGIDTPSIPTDMLTEYLVGDIENTEIVFRAQYKKACQLGMLPLIESQMDALLMTTMMEWNGMAFDKNKAEDISSQMSLTYDTLMDKAIKQMDLLSPLPKELTWNPMSTQHLSIFLYGGQLKYRKEVPDCDETGEQKKYKTGKNKGELKYKKIDAIHGVLGQLTPKVKMGKSGFFPVGDGEIKNLKVGVIPYVLELRDLKKQISTYFGGYSKLVWPDGMIHGSLNHCQTETGRLSSSSPNLQNISNVNTEI